MNIKVGMTSDETGTDFLVIEQSQRTLLNTRDLLRLVKQHNRELWDEVAREIILPPANRTNGVGP